MSGVDIAVIWLRERHMGKNTRNLIIQRSGDAGVKK